MSVMDFDERALRLAPVMTGGTSLAVWMGGVTAELYAMVRSPHEPDRVDLASRVYRGLLAATITKPVIDVITGTSAGGLNGTLLGAASMLGVPIDRYKLTRNTWLSLGDLEQLMRKPSESDPPSLLHGDAGLGDGLRSVLRQWEADHGPASADTPIDMVTTVTTLVPEPRHRLDHFGESMAEVDHAQWIRITRDDVDTPDWIDKMALAARTSASIPGVFEPSYLPVGADDAQRSGRPDLDGNASFSRSRWAFADRPTIAQSLVSVVTAPRAEGVSADIDQLERHNAAVERQTRTRRTMAHLVEVVLGEIEVHVGRGDDAGPGRTDVGINDPFTLYRTQRASSSIDHMVQRVRRAVGAVPLDPTELEAVIRRARTELLPERIDQLAGPTASWGWGIAPVEEAVSIALGPIGRTQRLATAGTSPDSRALLSTAQIEVHEAREVARRIRTLDDAYWRGRFESMPGRSRVTGLIDPDTFRRAAPEEWAVGSYAEWPVAGDEEARIATFIELGAAHLQVANAITSAFSAIAEITQSCGAVPGSSEGPGVGSQASSFAQAILDEALGLLAAGDDQRVVQRQLLRVHVAQTLLLGDVETREQRIDLMQLSWNTYNGLAPERAPNDKLAGPELARLGAFLKHSWRANDWLWGRMDGAHRLVVLLLDPGRLAQVHASAAAARAAIEQATGVAIPDDAARELDYIDAGIDRAALAAAARRSAGHRGADRHRARGAAHRRRGGPHVEGTWGQHRRECRLRGVGTEGGRSRRPRRHLRWAGGRHRQGDAHRSRDRRCGARLFADEPNPEPGCLRRRQRPHRFRGRAALRRWRPASPATPAARRQQPRVGDDQRLSRLARGATAFILAVAGTIVALRVVGIAVPTGTFAVAAVLFIGAVVVAMLRSGFALMGTAVGGIALVIALTLTGPDLAEVVYSGEHATTDGELPAGTGIELDGPGVVRVTQGDGSAERISDIEVDGAVVVLRDAGGVIRGEPATDHVAGWKRWGFLEAWRGWCWWWSPWSSSPGPRRGASPWLVDMATGLHGYGLEIVLLLLVGVAVAISLGADLVVRRWSKVRRG